MHHFLGFIEPFMLLMLPCFVAFVETKLTWPYSSFIKYGVFALPSIDGFLFHSKLLKYGQAKEIKVFILFVCDGVMCKDFHALDWLHYVDTNFDTFVNSCSYGIWPCVSMLNVELCEWVHMPLHNAWLLVCFH